MLKYLGWPHFARKSKKFLTAKTPAPSSGNNNNKRNPAEKKSDTAGKKPDKATPPASANTRKVKGKGKK